MVFRVAQAHVTKPVEALEPLQEHDSHLAARLGHANKEEDLVRTADGPKAGRQLAHGLEVDEQPAESGSENNGKQKHAPGHYRLRD